MNLREKRAAALAKAREINAKADGGALSEDDVASIKSLLAEVESLDEQISKADEAAQLVAKIGALGVTGDPEPTGNDDGGAPKARDLGTWFVKSLQASKRSLKEPGTFSAPEFKAATDTQVVGNSGLSGAFGPLVTDVDREFVMPYRRPLVVADLLGSGSVSGNAITYPVYGALEGETAFLSEGGAKPQAHVADPTWRTDALGEVAGWFKITDDVAEDIPYLVSEINSTLLYDLQLKEELALLSGTGTAPQLQGILNRSGIQTLGKGTDSDPDRIFRAISNVQEVTGFAADGIVINPADYTAIRLSKDSNGQYFGGGFFAGQYGQGGITEQPPLWGLRTVVTSSVPQGTVVVGAFQAAAKVFRKGGVRVESTNSHADDFTNDKITIRVRERLGLQVKYPSAFVKVTLGLAA